jgi:fructokinase
MKKSCLLACEILWDCFEEGEFLGGATLNVAYHLNQLGTTPIIVSSVGKDELGDRAIKQIAEEWKCNTNAIRRLDHVTTGKVIVKIDQKGDATYVLQTPAAWDYVSLSKEDYPGLNKADAFVYGSVGLRMDYNQKQVDDFLKDYNGLKCFDVNLRIPHNSVDLVLKYAQKADFVKVNNDEINLLTGDMDVGTSLKNRMISLCYILNINKLCVTRAEKSAMMLYLGEFYEGNTFPVSIQDTVGAGDAFFAAMINALLKDDFNPLTALNKATALGSWVASNQGAQPVYNPQKLIEYLNK